MTFEDVVKRFFYATDKGGFYLRSSGSSVPEKTVAEALYKISGASIEMVTENINMMKDLGVPYGQGKPKRFNFESRNSIYHEIKELLPYLWYCEVSGNEMLYRMTGNEALPLMGTSSEFFTASIRSDNALHRALKAKYEKSPSLKESKHNLTFEDYVRHVHTEFIMDPEMCLPNEPSLLSWNRDEVTFKYFDASRLRKGLTPTWDQFLERVNFPEIFLAWVWTIFDPTNFGRQALWLYGQGSDGKSTVLNALKEIYDPIRTAAISSNSFATNFFFSTVYGKRFSTYGDCKNLRLISHEKIHSLLGNDNVQIERKGENAFTGRIYSRLLVSSNWHPQIDFNMANEVSRLVVLDVKKSTVERGDPDFEKNLIAEKWQLLYKCREMYNKYCPNGMDLELPETLREHMEDKCSSMESDFLEEFIEKRLDFEEDCITLHSDLYGDLKDFLLVRGNKDVKYLIKDLQIHLQRRGYSISRPRLPSGRRPKSWIGLRLKEKEI